MMIQPLILKVSTKKPDWTRIPAVIKSSKSAGFSNLTKPQREMPRLARC